ncbi:hypothetical protein PybrP1_000919 [[Pythium] brassicae (nom. inval.)]|nr:hypothetical protein PybrP1_000919 [[Pythium] brassicae (nom. inval.)]
MLSLFGYPDAKLSEWLRGEATVDAAVRARLDGFFATVLAIIRQGPSERAISVDDRTGADEGADAGCL